MPKGNVANGGGKGKAVENLDGQRRGSTQKKEVGAGNLQDC